MTRIVLALMLIFSTGLAQADVLLIEEVRQSERMNLPVNGISRDEVQARFGEPVSRLATVGDPPITRWNYASWSVYFEYELVLFTVLHKGAVIDRKRTTVN